MGRLVPRIAVKSLRIPVSWLASCEWALLHTHLKNDTAQVAIDWPGLRPWYQRVSVGSATDGTPAHRVLFRGSLCDFTGSFSGKRSDQKILPSCSLPLEQNALGSAALDVDDFGYWLGSTNARRSVALKVAKVPAVERRIFGGLHVEENAEAIGISAVTARWRANANERALIGH